MITSQPGFLVVANVTVGRLTAQKTLAAVIEKHPQTPNIFLDFFTSPEDTQFNNKQLLGFQPNDFDYLSHAQFIYLSLELRAKIVNWRHPLTGLCIQFMSQHTLEPVSLPSAQRISTSLFTVKNNPTPNDLLTEKDYQEWLKKRQT